MIILGTKMPEEGQFIVIWPHKKVMWADTLRYSEEHLERYESELDNWIPCTAIDHDFYSEADKQYIKML